MPERIEQYVKSGMIYYGEIPSPYKVFDPMNVHSVKEKKHLQGRKWIIPFCLNTPGSLPPTDPSRLIPTTGHPRHDAHLLCKRGSTVLANGFFPRD